MNYYRGNFYEEYKGSRDRRGWLIGQFMDIEDGARKTEKVEIKFWEFHKGEETKHRPKHQKVATEFTFILKGRVRGEIDGQPVILQENDYVVIPAGVPNNFPTKILEDARGLTVKAPSIADDTVKA
jgi:mannose-6-phosphate isomerase-like protein (cupin superfamily)